MKDYHPQILWIAWVANGEEFDACWKYGRPDGERKIAVSYRWTEQEVSDAPERIEQMARATSLSTIRVRSIGRGDTFCTARCDGVVVPKRNVSAIVLVGYDSTGRITCLGIPNPSLANTLTMHVPAGRSIVKVDLSAFIPVSRFPRFDYRGEDTTSIEDLLSAVSRKFRVDTNTGRLILHRSDRN